jgi:hypothetical protein
VSSIYVTEPVFAGGSEVTVGLIGRVRDYPVLGRNMDFSSRIAKI